MPIAFDLLCSEYLVMNGVSDFRLLFTSAVLLTELPHLHLSP